ncbi:hypothetical protein O181_130824 [Austropuccinia psidii MF-1]|uniref:Transposase Tc1-like domain-containing protein n=1 Tax=Austropuccinia psidii MF-1 TaxID=1389203 RepID=A0A9Q3QAG2_9BASI|nr:hypothetical protein [Austropuccinia psidii MF-1]
MLRRTIETNQGMYCWDAPSRPPILSDFGFSWDTALNRLQYEQEWQELDHIITQGHCLTVAQVTNLMTHTIQHEIHKLGRHLRIAPKKPYLWPQDFQQRLTFAQAHRHWTINDWAQVVWTDELAFELGKKVDRV